MSRSRLETCKRLVSVSAIDVSCPSVAVMLTRTRT